MNVKQFRSALCLSFILAAICSPTYAADLVLNNVPAEVFFSPKGGCTEAIIDEINDAKTEILVQAYSFTSAPIAKALLAAHKRGVRVEVILAVSGGYPILEHAYLSFPQASTIFDVTHDPKTDW